MKRIHFLSLFLAVCLFSAGCAARQDLPAATVGNTAAAEQTKAGTVCVIRRKEHWQGLLLFSGGDTRPVTDSINTLRSRLGEYIRVYLIPVPLAGLYSLPERYGKNQLTQQRFLAHLKKDLQKGAEYIDLAEEFRKRQNEDLFLRTDIGLTGRGAYIAARSFTDSAGLSSEPFKKYTIISSGTRCGPLCQISGDSRLLSDPEQAESCLPPISFRIDYYDRKMGYRRTSKYDSKEKTALAPPGTEEAVLRIQTEKQERRKLLLFTDGVGQSLLPFLIGPFSEIYAVDIHNVEFDLIRFVIEKKITDVAAAASVQTLSAGQFSTLQGAARSLRSSN